LYEDNGDPLGGEKSNSFVINHHVKSRPIVSPEGGDSIPVFSIAIPTYRRPELLRESIQSALNQEIDVQFEIVVVDNEQEESWSAQVDEVIRSFNSEKLFLYRNDVNLGIYGNWNRCIELCKGDWITLLSDDDILGPKFLATVADYCSGQGLVAVNTNSFGSRYVAPKQSLLKKVKGLMHLLRKSSNKVEKVGFSQLFMGNPFAGCLGVVMNRTACLDLGGYNPEYWPSSDYYLNARYCVKYGAIKIDEVHASYRWEANESFRPEVVKGFVTVNYKIRKYLVQLVRANFISRHILVIISRLLKYIQLEICISAYSMEDRRSELVDECELKRRFPVLKRVYTKLVLAVIATLSIKI